jgi:hypothetical protein
VIPAGGVASGAWLPIVSGNINSGQIGVNHLAAGASASGQHLAITAPDVLGWVAPPAAGGGGTSGALMGVGFNWYSGTPNASGCSTAFWNQLTLPRLNDTTFTMLGYWARVALFYGPNPAVQIGAVAVIHAAGEETRYGKMAIYNADAPGFMPGTVVWKSEEQAFGSGKMELRAFMVSGTLKASAPYWITFMGSPISGCPSLRANTVGGSEGGKLGCTFLAYNTDTYSGWGGYPASGVFYGGCIEFQWSGYVASGLPDSMSGFNWHTEDTCPTFFWRPSK